MLREVDGLAAPPIDVQSFNSLFEMLAITTPSAVMTSASTGFNSLFEMQGVGLLVGWGAVVCEFQFSI